MQRYIFALALASIVGAGAYWYSLQPNAVFTIDAQDTITSWDVQTAHKDGGELEQRVRDEIVRLNEHLADEATEPPDYQIHVGLSNQYLLLGDGEAAYEELLKALAIDSTMTGLAWHNMGTLMDRLGAKHSAREAFARAVDAQPHIDAYHSAYINFLMSRFGDDVLAVTSALDRAETQFNDDTFVFQLRAQYFTQTGAFEDAIAEWEKMKAGAPEDRLRDIDAEIARLRAKL